MYAYNPLMFHKRFVWRCRVPTWQVQVVGFVANLGTRAAWLLGWEQQVHGGVLQNLADKPR
jgi:hypothetical protein